MKNISYSYYLRKILLVPVLIYTSLSYCQERQNVSSISHTLLGLWGIEQTFGPVISGEIRIDLRTDKWIANLAANKIPIFINSKDSIKFNFPGNLGYFIGQVNRSAKKISGFWIQPPGIANFIFQRATPIELSQTELNVYVGAITPLPEAFQNYISIQRISKDSITAFFRDPVTNTFRGRVYNVQTMGDSLFLTVSDYGVDGFYDSEADALHLSILNYYPNIKLTRRNKNNAVGFYPRLPFGKSEYTYTKPIEEKDGWETATLKDVNIKPELLIEFMNKIISEEPSLDNPYNLHSVLIARHGKLVFEEYFYGFDKEVRHDLRSASKTYGPTLIGIAKDKGYKIDLDSSIHSFFPEYNTIENWDVRKNKITLKALMTMTSGYNCRGIYDEDAMHEQNEQMDWYKFILDMPLIQDPDGNIANYCSADINLLGGIVQNVTNEWLPGFFDKNLAQPLEMQYYHFNLQPNGEGYMGGGIYMRPRDFIKLGQLYLDKGNWNGKQILSEEWVNESLKVKSEFKPYFKGDENHMYGYGWHIKDKEVNNKTYRIYYMGGNGGQMTIIIPELDMVVGFTGGDYGQARKFFNWEIEYLPKYILSSAIPEQK